MKSGAHGKVLGFNIKHKYLTVYISQEVGLGHKIYVFVKTVNDGEGLGEIGLQLPR